MENELLMLIYTMDFVNVFDPLASMTSPINGSGTSPALYTVEQLELIRRLRNSGITREDVANAFDTFDRLDRELGPVYNIPVTLVSCILCLQIYKYSLIQSLHFN